MVTSTRKSVVGGLGNTFGTCSCGLFRHN